MSKKVYLSPSTQEKNIGAGTYGTEEYRANLIADVTEKELKRHGVVVYRNKPTMTLTEVVKDSNSHDIDCHVATHTNAYNKVSRGCEVFCYRKDDTRYVKGYNLASYLYANVSAITPTSDRGVKQGYNFYGTGKHMYEVTYTKATAALIEVAFHDNVDDAKWIINNIESIGIEIAKAILQYLNITYVPEVKVNKIYIVQCGAFGDLDNANTLVKNLKKSGFDSFIKTVEV